MHPTSTLAEAPPNSDNPRGASHLPPSPRHQLGSVPTAENHVSSDGTSPPARKDTNSSISTAATALTSVTRATNESHEPPESPYSSVSPSPTFAHAVFSARDGSNVAPQRRASRRRTGPLTAVQRERAHLIRKMGACSDCRRRRVACHPNHHNMTWEDAAKRFRSLDSSSQGLSALAGPQLSPAPPNSRGSITQDPREMDLDTSPSQHHPPALSEARIRTPLPSGPRPEKHTNMPPLPGFEAFRADLQGSADRILANPFRSRYAHVSVLLVGWQDDQDAGAQSAINELAKTFHEDYNYIVHVKSIPTSPEGSRSPWLWLSQAVTDFVADHNQRDCLKIFYYSGYSYLDGNRDAVLASSKHADPVSVIRWSAIQQYFENARADALLLMDCAYFPSYTTVRRQGMLELIAASAGEDHVGLLGRSAFTRALTDQLRTRAVQPFKEPFSAAELHSKLLSLYPRIIQEQNPEREVVARFPTPLSMQLSGTKTLPSILLAPLRHGEAHAAPSAGSQISITFRLADDTFNMDSWAEWLRSMPEGITEARVDGPFRNTNTFQ